MGCFDTTTGLGVLVLCVVSATASAAPSLAPAARPAHEPLRDSVDAPVTTERGVTPHDAMVLVRPIFGIAGRHFDFADRMTKGLRTYDVVATPVLGLGAEVYPAPSVPVVGGLGAFVDYVEAPGLVSERGGQPVNASWRRFDVGARYRVKIGRASLVGARISYGGSDFRHAESKGADVDSVTASYRFARAGLETRVGGLGPLIGTAAVDAILPHDLGPLATRFPRATGLGVGARLGVALPIMRHVELGSALAYERLAFDLRPEPGDRHVAGGALDEHWRLEVAATFFY